MDGSDLQPYLERVPMAGQLAMVILVAVGLTLWVLGRKLARPVCAVSGLMIGGFLALVLSQALGDRAKLLIWVIIGCLAGATVGWLLFRVFMAVSLSTLLAVLLPAAVVFWHGPLDAESGDAGDKPPTWLGSESESLVHSDAINRLQAQLADRYERSRNSAIDWWTSQPPGRRQAMAVAASVGALAGLVLGVAAPYLSASLGSALVGSILVMGASWRFLSGFDAIPAWMPTHPAVLLSALGLITLVGMLVQWTIFRAAADK